MKIGLLAEYDKDELDFMQKNGFKSMELIVRPGGPLDPAITDEKAILSAKKDLSKRAIEVSAIGHYSNNLDPDSQKREQNINHLENLMDLCEKMQVKTLCTFAGRDPEKDIPDNIPIFKEVYEPLSKKAEDKGLRIGFENCPMFHYFPFRGINIAYTPRAWDLMFDAVPSEALGIEYDPSHPVCLCMDYIGIVHEFGDRIYHVHAKDAEVVDRNVRRNGILEPGAVRHRMPGLGQVDWPSLISALVKIGYDGNLDIEGRHDPVYRDDREEEGLLIAFKHLSACVA